MSIDKSDLNRLIGVDDNGTAWGQRQRVSAYHTHTQYVWEVRELNFCTENSVNNVVANITNASYGMRSNEYAYKISIRLVASVSSYIRMCTVCSWYLVRACNTEQRSAIKFRARLQKSFVETYSTIQQAFGDEAASRSTLRVHGGNGLKTVESRRVTTNEVEGLQRLFTTRTSRRRVCCCSNHLISPFES